MLSAESTPLNRTQKYGLPILLTMAIFMQMLDVTILNTALPAIARDLNESALNMQSVVVSYVLTVAVCIPLSGYLSDKYGTQRMFITAISLFGLGSILCALSTTLPMLVGARIVQGLGGALLTPVARLALMRSFKGRQLMQALNYAVMPALMGPMLGPLVGGYLVENASWHWIFLMNIPFALIAIVVGYKIMPNFVLAHPSLDVFGVVLVGSSAFLLTLGFETAGNTAMGYNSLWLVLVAVLLLWAYRSYALSHPLAIYPLHLWKVRTFRIGLNSSLMARVGMAAVPFLLPLLFQVVFGYSPMEAAWLLIPTALAAMMTKPLLQPLMRRFSYRKVLLWNTTLVGLLLMSLATFSAHTPKVAIVVHLFILGMANSIQFSAMSTLIVSDLRDYQKSSGNSLMSVTQQLAMGLGTALAAMLLRLNQHWLEPKAADSVYVAFQLTFIMIGLVTLVAGWLFRYLHQYDGRSML